MKHIPVILPLQKALAFVLAVLVFVLATVVSSRGANQSMHEGERDAFVTVSSIQSTAGLPSLSDATPKVHFILFTLASIWSLLFLLKALEGQRHQTVGRGIFLQKVNFIFVSTKAP